MNNRKKNIAIMSTMYYPDMGAPSACVDKYVQELKDKYNFFIITKTYQSIIKKNNRYNICYISNWMHRIIVRSDNNITNGRNVCINKLLLMFVNLYKLIITQFCYPTSGSWETREYYNALLRLHREVKLDVILAVSNTFFTQLAATKFKKEHSDVKYISFIYDPFSENDVYYQYKLFKSFWKKLNVKHEELVYQKADIIFFSEEMYKFVFTAFDFDYTKAKSMHFTLTNFQRGESKVCKPNEIKLIYAGALYKKIRNPEYMLSVLSQLTNIRLDLFVDKGECESIIQKYLSSNINRAFFASRERYESMISNEYDILINIGNISTLQAPSKMLELLSTGKPILNFYFLEDSQFEMIERYPLGLNIGFQEKDAVQKVERFCEANKGKRLTFKEVLKLYPDNSLDTQVALLENVINN